MNNYNDICLLLLEELQVLSIQFFILKNKNLSSSNNSTKQHNNQLY